MKAKDNPALNPDGAMPPWRILLPLFLPALVLAVFVTAGILLPAEQWLKGVLEWSQAAGFRGVLAVMGGYVFTCIFVLPTSIFTFGAGFLYGFWLGAPVAVFGSTLGAGVAYGIARAVLGPWILKRADDYRPLAVVRVAGEQGHVKFLLLTRMSPLTPFGFLNYLYGALSVPLGRFIWTTSVGMLPGTLLCVFIGAGLRSLSGVVVDPAAGPAWPFWLGIIGFMVAIVLISVYARRAIKDATQHLEQEKKEDYA